jgi:hypothetical protein
MIIDATAGARAKQTPRAWVRVSNSLHAIGIATLCLIASPALAGNHVSGSNAITVAPGDTGNCATSPCQVTLQMPPGEGSYEVTGNEVRIGTYPAGQAVNLGNFFESQALAIKGAGVKKTYVYIPKDM